MMNDAINKIISPWLSMQMHFLVFMFLFEGHFFQLKLSFFRARPSLYLLFLCLFKLLDEFPQPAVFKALAVSSWSSDCYYIIRVLWGGKIEMKCCYKNVQKLNSDNKNV